MNSCLSSATNWWRSHGTLRTLYLLLLGQLVSFVLAMMSFTSSLIATLGVDAPLTQTIPTYLGLALVYGSILLYRREKLRVSWYWYVLLGFVDVQGNYLGEHDALIHVRILERKVSSLPKDYLPQMEWEILTLCCFDAVNKAYQFSSITSVTLLDCFTIAWVLLLTWIFLGTRYSLWQLFGSAICVVGLGLVLLSDAGVGGGGGSKPLLGDILVIAGTIFFAMSNVGEEFCVKKKDRVEVICMIGTYGFLDLHELTQFFRIQRSGATLLNLSILTSDMWAVVVRIFFYRQQQIGLEMQVDWLYYVAFSVVVIGLIIYSLTYVLTLY
ncbi:hypothetical protein DVH24_019154 [Malus domestica]|uniref:EamA domain-containing protein n=1 Tax=Malus domestica TaxID=3750 RepID=A0A498HXZ4_MALDO|nr:hypothetical protein DVH24_019154 [Malus domestica]